MYKDAGGEANNDLHHIVVDFPTVFFYNICQIGGIMDIGSKRTPTIFVVDDDVKFRKFIHETLSAEGFSVDHGSSGQETLDACSKESYDLLLLDVKLPDMSGKDVLKALHEKYPSTDVMIVTGYQDINLVVELLKLGAKEYLTKPIEPEDLIGRVRSTLRAHTAEQRLKQLQFDFFSRLLYDLRNPVNTITLTLDHLKNEAGDGFTDPQRRLLENIRATVSQMNILLNDMIDLTLLESGNVEIEKLPTNLDELLPSLCDRFKPQAIAK